MSKYFQPNPDEKNNIKVLLSLLEKAELILSIVNLPETTINKYNHLKEITYEKLNLEFTPINMKRQAKIQNMSARNINSNSWNFYDIKNKSNNENTSSIFNSINLTNNLDQQLNRLRSINNRKTIIIEYLFELMEKFKFENNDYMRQYLNDNANLNLGFLMEKADGNLNNLSKSANFREDLDFDLKLEELKIKDFIGKSDICYRKFVANIKNLNNLNNQNFDNINNNKSHLPNRNSNKDNYGKSSNNKGQASSLKEIAAEFERKVEQLKWEHEQEIKEYREKFNELRVKYNPDLEVEYMKLREAYEVKTYVFDKINTIVDPVYDKYYGKNTSWYEKIMIQHKYEELGKFHFLVALVNKFFSDNKYLLDMVSDVQKEKAVFIEERSMPFVLNAVQKNSALQDIHADLASFEKNNDLLYKNIDQVLDYMAKNIEGLV